VSFDNVRHLIRNLKRWLLEPATLSRIWKTWKRRKFNNDRLNTIPRVLTNDRKWKWKRNRERRWLELDFVRFGLNYLVGCFLIWQRNCKSNSRAMARSCYGLFLSVSAPSECSRQYNKIGHQSNVKLGRDRWFAIWLSSNIFICDGLASCKYSLAFENVKYEYWENLEINKKGKKTNSCPKKAQGEGKLKRIAFDKCPFLKFVAF
jgi:hypothetical protein